MSKIIAVTGLPGSGKSTVVDYLVQKGFHRVYFGQVTLDELKNRGLEVNEQNEKEVREGQERDDYVRHEDDRPEGL